MRGEPQIKSREAARRGRKLAREDRSEGNSLQRIEKPPFGRLAQLRDTFCSPRFASFLLRSAPSRLFFRFFPPLAGRASVANYR